MNIKTLMRMSSYFLSTLPEFVTFVNNPDGSPKYEDTCVYAILEKEWNTIRQW